MDPGERKKSDTNVCNGISSPTTKRRHQLQRSFATTSQSSTLSDSPKSGDDLLAPEMRESSTVHQVSRSPQSNRRGPIERQQTIEHQPSRVHPLEEARASTSGTGRATNHQPMAQRSDTTSSSSSSIIPIIVTSDVITPGNTTPDYADTSNAFSTSIESSSTGCQTSISTLNAVKGSPMSTICESPAHQSLASCDIEVSDSSHTIDSLSENFPISKSPISVVVIQRANKKAKEDSAATENQNANQSESKARLDNPRSNFGGPVCDCINIHGPDRIAPSVLMGGPVAIKGSDVVIVPRKQEDIITQQPTSSAKATEFESNLKPILNTQSPKHYNYTQGDDTITPAPLYGNHPIHRHSEHFEITWSNLSYKIEPKWYKKIDFLDRLFSHFTSSSIDNHSSATSTVSSSAGMNDNQHQMHASANCSENFQPIGKSPADAIEIFNNLNGSIKSGQLTAILGPSGAGKTTLLNCLTGKLRKSVTGNINLLGANGKHLKMCTIPQKDHLLDLLTVEENLWFASKIKNPEYGFDHAKNIERVIELLGLKRCRAAKIKKISGGQHKRVSIAQELLSNPDILVLDEPTSGLDSLTCFKTISMLRDLVELSASNEFIKPMAIIVTIHQPQPKVFNLFHHVYILANGGKAIYEGSPLTSLKTITSVSGLEPNESAKSSNQASGFVDPASFLIEIASEEYGAEPIKVLCDHQRRTFAKTNGLDFMQDEIDRSPDPDVELCGDRSPIPLGSTGGNVNEGFTPEFESGNRPDSKASVMSTGSYVQNQLFANLNANNNRRNLGKKSKGKSTSKELSKKYNEDREVTVLSVDINEGSKVSKRRKSSYSLERGELSTKKSSHSLTSSSLDSSFFMSEQLRYTREANHKGKFWSHTATLAHRTLLTIRRDPLLMTSRVLFHLMIPILMRYVYGKSTGAANACPKYEPEIDINQISSMVESKRIESMLEELHMSIENVSMFFIIMYAFAAAVLALNALSFPLNMQVLLKETRNGWYSMSSYVVAKTLADLPLELTMPSLTMALVYPLTGQPSSNFQWRAVTICLIMTLCSLVAQTQALILGALVMNSVETAVFVSQASQLPWVILAGFTIRIKRLSEPLKLISLTSFYRLGCEAITLTRYGFGICACDPKVITGKPVKLVGIPSHIRYAANLWLDTYENSRIVGESEDSENTTSVTPSIATVTETPRPDIFQNLANQLSYANSYGVNITSCDDVAPDRIRAINLSDNWLAARIWHLIIMLIIMKLLLYYAVRFSINIRL